MLGEIFDEKGVSAPQKLTNLKKKWYKKTMITAAKTFKRRIFPPESWFFFSKKWYKKKMIL